MVLRCGNVVLSIAMCTSFYIEAFWYHCRIYALFADVSRTCRNVTIEMNISSVSRDWMVCDIYPMDQMYFNFLIIKTLELFRHVLSYPINLVRESWLSWLDNHTSKIKVASRRTFDSEPLFSCVVFLASTGRRKMMSFVQTRVMCRENPWCSLLRSTVVRISEYMHWHLEVTKSHGTSYADRWSKLCGTPSQAKPSYAN